MNDPKILVIDDEPQLRKLLQIILESSGFKSISASTAREGVISAATHFPDLILLDLGLPDKSGQETLKELRQWYNKPIIILSVQNSEDDIVAALDNGAADYLVKPFRTGELLARMRSALRRIQANSNDTVITCENIQVDLTARTIKKEGETIKLTVTEYNLLVLLIKNEGKVLTHQYLLKEIWGAGYQNETQYLRVFIAQLRKKIEEIPDQPAHIITESGVGYRFL